MMIIRWQKSLKFIDGTREINKRLKFILLVEVVVLLSLLLWGLEKYISQTALVLWDEGIYLSKGFDYYNVLRDGDWGGMWQMIRDGVEYPFLHSFWLGVVAVFFGYSIKMARMASLFLLLPTVLLVILICRQIKKGGFRWAIMSSFLILSSPLILFFFSMAMREGLGMFLTYLCLYLYFEARDKRSEKLYVLAGFFLLLLFFVKFYYGVIVSCSVGIGIVVSYFRKEFDRKDVSRLMLMGLVVLVPLWWWILVPTGNYVRLLAFMRNIGDHQAGVLTHIYFYFYHLAVSYTFSPFVFVLLLWFFVRGVKANFSDYRLRCLMFLVVINLLVFLLRTNKNQARYIIICVPALFVVGAMGLGNMIGFLKKRWLMWSIILVAGYDLLMLPARIKPTISHNLNSNVFFEMESAKDYYFNFDRSKWPTSSLTDGSARMEELFDDVFSGVDLNKPIQLVSFANEFGPPLFDYQLAWRKDGGYKGRIDNRYSEYAVSFLVLEDGMFDSEDYRLNNAKISWEQYEKYDISSDWQKLMNKEYDDLGVKISVWGKNE